MDKYQQAIVKSYELKQQVQRLSNAIGHALRSCTSEMFGQACLPRAYKEIRSDFTIDPDGYVANSCCMQCQKAHALIQERKKLRLSLGAAKGHLTKLGKALVRGNR